MTMNNLMVREVDFNGGKLLAIKDNGKVYMGVKRACYDIGLTDGQSRRQVQNLTEDVVLNQGVTNLVLPTGGGVQSSLVIELDFVPLWLAKISITPKMKRDNPLVVQKLIQYQLQAKQVLADAFLTKSIQAPPQLTNQITMIQDLGFGYDESRVLVMESYVNGMDPVQLALNTLKGRLNQMSEIRTSKQRGRIVQRVQHIAALASSMDKSITFNETMANTWRSLSDNLKFEEGIDMREIRERAKRQREKDKLNNTKPLSVVPTYPDLIHEYDMHESAEKALHKMVRQITKP